MAILPQHPLAIAFKLVLMLFLCGHRASPGKFAWMCAIAVGIFAYVAPNRGVIFSFPWSASRAALPIEQPWNQRKQNSIGMARAAC
jgi:hypothetical protein